MINTGQHMSEHTHVHRTPFFRQGAVICTLYIATEWDLWNLIVEALPEKTRGKKLIYKTRGNGQTERQTPPNIWAWPNWPKHMFKKMTAIQQKEPIYFRLLHSYPQLVFLTCLPAFSELKLSRPQAPPSNWCFAHCCPPWKPPSFCCVSLAFLGVRGSFRLIMALLPTTTNCFAGATKLFTRVSAS